MKCFDVQPWRSWPRLSLAFLALLLNAYPVLAHPGGVDEAGCHWDRDTRGYHCHRGALKGRHFATKTDMLKAETATGVRTAAEPPIRTARIARVVDGDTMILESGEHVRLIGVDAAELRARGSQDHQAAVDASRFVRTRLASKTVRLEFDEANAPAYRDHYGRTLAYVYLVDGSLLNLEIVRHGYAKALTRFPFGKTKEFLQAQSDACRLGLGMWEGSKGRSCSNSP